MDADPTATAAPDRSRTVHSIVVSANSIEPVLQYTATGRIATVRQQQNREHSFKQGGAAAVQRKHCGDPSSREPGQLASRDLGDDRDSGPHPANELAR